jgi:hypothetical protein
MSGNTRNLDERLRSGSATGALRLAAGEFPLRVCKGPKGRGLCVVEAVPKGAVLCRLPGKLVECAEPPAGREVLYARRGCWLVLDPPTAAAPGNLVNTSNGTMDGGNNAELVYKAGNAFATLKTLRALAGGAEVLAAYGRSYTSALRKRAAEAASEEADARARAPHPLSSVTCGACGATMRQRDAAKHRTGVWCKARPNPRVQLA